MYKVVFNKGLGIQSIETANPLMIFQAHNLAGADVEIYRDGRRVQLDEVYTELAQR